MKKILFFMVLVSCVFGINLQQIKPKMQGDLDTAMAIISKQTSVDQKSKELFKVLILLFTVFIQTVNTYIFSILYVESTFPVTVENIKIKRYSPRLSGICRGSG